MLTKRTIIGMIVGSAIIGIGAYSLVSDIGFQSVSVEETIGAGEPTTFQIYSNNGSSQSLSISGEKFDLTMTKPGQEKVTSSHQGGVTEQWMHLEDGVTHILIRNTGPTDLVIDADFEVTTDPILFSYHIIVITSGVVIIGFSIGFTARRPKGF